MAASAGEVELVDLSAADDAPGPPRAPRRRASRPAAALLAVLVVAVLGAAGAWQHRSALEEQRAQAQAAAEEQRLSEGRAAANALEQRVQQVRWANRAVTDAVTGATSTPLHVPGAAPTPWPAGASGGLVWAPADLGPRAAHADEPLDLQAVGAWPGTSGEPGAQRIGYRLVTGLPAASGGTPCLVPSVRISQWGYDQGGDPALDCRVMASGVRGTALREGTSGAGASQVQVREVVLVSEGRAASVAAWSTGGAPLVLDGPALGAAAAALLASAGGS
ncbi:hypothetical protein FHN55_04920 [Streptomyces sp. NP160]|uniref:hypothetical protein n=1 Tax=Streptomyces sp. NP160 TaxID=2586637 RepID=UPI001117E556|nr:hypothetical protein [Streptomyces sp. NP160]TNM69131.1 hypothetical protein FHN55_04920 [Streptomyces sp. NP160]